MKKVAFSIAVAALISGCKTADIKQITSDAVSGAIDGVLNSSESISSSGTSDSSTSYSVKNERISTVESKKTKRDYGSVSIVKTEKNPKGQTRLALDLCTHPRIGELRCGGYIFEMTEEGWLKDSPITFDDINNPELTLPAGDYYLKFSNWNSGYNRFATGAFTIEPFVTNIVQVELE